MFGLSFFEIAVVMLISFLIFGPEQFPVMVKKAIQQISQLKKYMYQAQSSFHDFTRDIEKDFNPNKWTSSDSVAHSTSSETEKAIALLPKVSTNPSEYESVAMKHWRWESITQGKPQDFETETFDWKTTQN